MLRAEAIEIDPQRFQFKIKASSQGATGSLAGVSSWSQSAEGVLDVWLDPVNLKTYVVNGHNRLGLAKRLGVTHLPCKYLRSETWQDARRDGAVANLASGSGSELDAARFFRDDGATAAELQCLGLSPRSKVVRDGLKISRLPSATFSLALSGVLSPDHAAVLGDSGLNESQQIGLLKALGDVAHMSRLEFTEAIAASRVAAFESSTELTLFGSETFSRCLIAETAKVQSWVVSRLSRDRHALRSAVSNRDTLEAEGSSIESSQADLAAGNIAAILEQFHRLKSAPGPISTAIAKAARSLALGQPLPDAAQTVIDRLLGEARVALASPKPSLFEQRN
ncbi:MAG: hypothetical protein ACFB9N_05010 [Geitlerinemataceae cyanobacterium]